eukprot:gene23982-29095_t
MVECMDLPACPEGQFSSAQSLNCTQCTECTQWPLQIEYQSCTSNTNRICLDSILVTHYDDLEAVEPANCGAFEAMLQSATEYNDTSWNATLGWENATSIFESGNFSNASGVFNDSESVDWTLHNRSHISMMVDQWVEEGNPNGTCTLRQAVLRGFDSSNSSGLIITLLKDYALTQGRPLEFQLGILVITDDARSAPFFGENGKFNHLKMGDSYWFRDKPSIIGGGTERLINIGARGDTLYLQGVQLVNGTTPHGLNKMEATVGDGCQELSDCGGGVFFAE